MEKFLECGMNIGEQMLICGGEVHRVEDSLKRIFHAIGFARTDVFIITSSMVVTVHTKDGKAFTQTRRITDTGIDFEKLHKLNELSRKICRTKMNADQINRELSAISQTKVYPLWLECVCYAVIAGAFALFFGGGIIEAITALVIGVVVRLLIILADSIVSNKIFSKFAASFIATVLAWAAFKAGIIPGAQNVIIGSIMAMLPGIGLTNALRDLLVGDSIAGLLRTIEASITALAIAAGYFIIAILAGGIAV
ncbi:MAG: threonine/serine exporter family protein [Ruminococcus sp.]